MAARDCCSVSSLRSHLALRRSTRPASSLSTSSRPSRRPRAAVGLPASTWSTCGSVPARGCCNAMSRCLALSLSAEHEARISHVSVPAAFSSLSSPKWSSGINLVTTEEPTLASHGLCGIARRGTLPGLPLASQGPHRAESPSPTPWCRNPSPTATCPHRLSSVSSAWIMRGYGVCSSSLIRRQRSMH